MMLLVHFVVVNSKKKETERRIDTIKILSRAAAACSGPAGNITILQQKP
jgi:hypothetical protein